MNFNVYLDDDTGRRLNEMAERVGETRNGLIRRAVDALLAGQGRPVWPDLVQRFGGIPEMPAFESLRDDLDSPKDDPLA